MCIVVDTNVFASVFISRSKDFHKFELVHNWLFKTNNKSYKLVYGGTKYLGEIGRSEKYLDILSELSKKRKTLVLDKDIVDEMTEIIDKATPDECDDPHLVAIFALSKCNLLCTNDIRSIKYLKNSEFYPDGFKGPKIYKDNRNKDLLTDKYIAAICKENN